MIFAIAPLFTLCRINNLYYLACASSTCPSGNTKSFTKCIRNLTSTCSTEHRKNATQGSNQRLTAPLTRSTFWCQKLFILYRECHPTYKLGRAENILQKLGSSTP